MVACFLNAATRSLLDPSSVCRVFVASGLVDILQSQLQSYLLLAEQDQILSIVGSFDFIYMKLGNVLLLYYLIMYLYPRQKKDEHKNTCKRMHTVYLLFSH